MILDKFYTKPSVAKLCVDRLENIISFSDFSHIIEPSCGNGSFVPYLPDDTIYLDIAPELDIAIQQDFYTYSVVGDNVCIVGNPPFGVGGKEAVKFFNHASTFANVIAFIVPRTFKRISIQNRLSLGFHLVDQMDIDIGSFTPKSMKAKCVFQVWMKMGIKREKVSLPSSHVDFEFVSDINMANIAIKAYGGTGDCGSIEFDFKGLNPKAYHYIKCDDSVVNTFRKLDYYPLAGDTVRQDSIGRKELVLLYNEYNRRKD